jgi:hypothetical protein
VLRHTLWNLVGPVDCGSKELPRHIVCIGRPAITLALALGAGYLVAQALDCPKEVFVPLQDNYSLVQAPNGKNNHSILIQFLNRC